MGLLPSKTTSGDVRRGMMHQRKHNPPFTEVSGGSNIVVPAGGPAHAVTIVYSPTKKGSTKDLISITSDDPTHKKAMKVKLKGKAK